MGLNKTIRVFWQYEDELDIDITDGMFRASKVDGVRLYPYVIIDSCCYYLET